ncbi:Hsp20/alpha crystallin family protein [Flavihumibacter profundi]|jgi:HSP20 family protein|uniref:Hsp20/alpha crystallin family protein n=1 Tax=Flavihumibacter profundi TaxID=2716883 RepID=UPI001CC75715|nr:Hsp20/alpha crystallin family protein [Flavihumibacter profundi]MBZ5856249.1 Hsp20/alpha crystallin family protein [Flavihumibacter profundi]
MTFVKVNQPARQFGTMLDNLFQDIPSFIGREVSQAIQPAPVNIAETAEAYHLELNAPGRNKEDFKVTVENGLLTISYEQKEEEKVSEIKSVRKEFSLPSFKRTFTVDEKIETNNIQAKYENGLLKLYLPKKEAVKVQPQAIAIQ